ncbi:PAC2 family-domain-containing protein [Dioszegia hungarica]|uniref:Proteasome assembly chaperone 2 n=1 Tax=Dioszegia hungarica TaxID=4972 RepID=A0AA38H8I5_9TREE|nr:PAC2 family-domain-containing protein [Dioszegia hungarica]KAI9635853.1 PAC2 family-domain-containing protein [Dioszegia hungarica]
MTFYPDGDLYPAGFATSTLVVPSVSLANLPQLCVDLLITSLGLKRVGWIGKGDTVAPFAGRGEQGEVVTGGLEVYGSAEQGLYVIQQRSPTLKSKKDEHVELLRSFAEDSKFGFVLVLTSLDAANQDDAQLLAPHQHIAPPSTPAPSDVLDRLRSFPALSLSLASDRPPTSDPQRSTAQYPPFLPSAGLTRRLLAALQTTSTPHGCLTVWCAEGDNREDAYALTARVLYLLDNRPEQIKEPRSWKGLFGVADGWSGGHGADSEIYG